MATTGTVAGKVITDLFQNVDSLGQTYVQTTYQALANALGGSGTGGTVVTLLLTLYVVMWGIGIWAGTAQGSPTEIVYRLFRVFVICTLALKWAEFQSFIYNFVNQAPDAIGKAMLSSGSNGFTSLDSVQTGLQKVVDITADASEKFVRNSGLLSWGVYIYSMSFQFVMYLLVGFATAAIVLAKVMTWILLAIAPIFILLMLFGVTSRFTMGWINAVLLFSVLQILVYAFLAFYLSLVVSTLDALQTKANTVQVAWADIIPAELMGLVGIALMIQIPSVAGMIVGSGGFSWGLLGRFLKLGSLVRTPRRPLNYDILPPKGGGPSSGGASPAPQLPPPARHLAPPPLLLAPPSHYNAEARRLANQIKNNL